MIEGVTDGREQGKGFIILLSNEFLVFKDGFAVLITGFWFDRELTVLSVEVFDYSAPFASSKHSSESLVGRFQIT